MSEHQDNYIVKVREEMTGDVVVAADSKEDAINKVKMEGPIIGDSKFEWNNNPDTFQVEEAYRL